MTTVDNGKDFMITRNELFEIGRLKGITNKGFAEKDYLLELIMFLVSSNSKDELVFKGGTCLYKFYKLNRFSEDLDFSEIKEFDLDKLVEKIILGLKRFDVEASIHKKKEPQSTVLLSLRIKGPLFDGNNRSLCTIRVDVNKKSKIELLAENKSFSSIYNEIPSFNLLVMQEKEILAEKFRAIMSRKKARDLFDAFQLMKKGTDIDFELVNKKLEYYNEKFNEKEFMTAVESKKDTWNKELKALTTNVPEFEEVKKFVLGEVKKQLRKKN